MSLVNKIKNAKVGEPSILPDEQLQHLKDMTLKFNDIKDELYNEFKDAVNKLNNENLGFSVSGSMIVSTPSYDSLNRFRFTHAYKVSDLISIVRKLSIKYYYEVIGYVSRIYNLEISGDEYHDIGIVSEGGIKVSSIRANNYEELIETFTKVFTEDYDYKPIVKWLAFKTDTTNFTQYGIDLFKSKIKRTYFISYNQLRWELKGVGIKITNFKRLDTDYNGTPRTDYNTFNLIQEMFNFFESGDINKRNGFNTDLLLYNNIRNFDFPVIEFDNFDKVASFKLFKNGSAEIKFKNKKYIEEFLEFYNLKYID